MMTIKKKIRKIVPLVCACAVNLWGISENFFAQTSCYPTSCTPPCDGSCHYQTCSKPKTLTVPISQLPFSFSGTPPDACSGVIGASTITQMPFSIGSNSVNTLPIIIVIDYYSCANHTLIGPPCPPPPPGP